MIPSVTPQYRHEWLETCGAGARVLVLDDGFATGCPDVVPIEVRKFLQQPTLGIHGCKVCQVLAGTNPRRPGMAPAAELYVGQILGRQQEWKAIRAGLAWALELKVDVVNLSWAAHASDPECDEILNDLNAAGIIVVAACNPYLHWPHSRPTVIAAGLRGSSADCDILARGEAHVLRNGRLEAFRGPSVASANVAGMAACAKAFDKSISREQFLGEFATTPQFQTT